MRSTIAFPRSRLGRGGRMRGETTNRDTPEMPWGLGSVLAISRTPREQESREHERAIWKTEFSKARLSSPSILRKCGNSLSPTGRMALVPYSKSGVGMFYGALPYHKGILARGNSTSYYEIPPGSNFGTAGWTIAQNSSMHFWCRPFRTSPPTSRLSRSPMKTGAVILLPS